MKKYNKLTIEDKVKFNPRYFNTDGTHRFYVVDTLSSDQVEMIIEDRGLNQYAIVDTTIFFSLECDDIVDSKSVYIFVNDNYLFLSIPYVERFNAFSNHRFWESGNFEVSTSPLFPWFFRKMPDYDGETYYEYFDKHAQKYGTKYYLQFPIISKPLYYVVLLMEGSVYNSLAKDILDNYGDEPYFVPIDFRDPSAYYRVLVPVSKECE
ncbi:MAG: hypothetical protein K2N16_03000 [Muribaculaceae bacterium]|nr:hypothetical protein [Muribaculaceae bacterium]